MTMTGIRKHLTYANIVATLAAFAVLAGGTAFAASQLAKNSVGSKQLKGGSVTTAKLKKNAVSAAKIKKSAVTGAKVKGSSLTDGDLEADAPFLKISEEIRQSGNLALPVTVSGDEFTVYPLQSGTYTQPAGRTDSYVGAVDIEVSAECEDPAVVGIVLIDPKNPTKPGTGEIGNIAAFGGFEADGFSPGAKRFNLGAYGGGGGTRAAPPAAINRNLVVSVRARCKSGTGVTVTGASIDVIGLE